LRKPSSIGKTPTRRESRVRPRAWAISAGRRSSSCSSTGGDPRDRPAVRVEAATEFPNPGGEGGTTAAIPAVMIVRMFLITILNLFVFLIINIYLRASMAARFT
jgi:hypothetical protein